MDSDHILSYRLEHDAEHNQAAHKDKSAAPPDPDVRHNRQCWECLRRRLICDFSRPGCAKCSAAGITCPGYNGKKPLTWLAPGKVHSRDRQSRKARQIVTNTKPKNNVEVEKAIADGASQHVVHSEGEMMQIRSVAFRTDTCDIIEALHYYNHQVYPTLLTNQLAPSPFVVPIEFLYLLPISSNHVLTSMALSHRILRLPQNLGRADLKNMSWRLHHHKGTAIRALNKEIDQPVTRTSDGTLASIILFLFAELQQSTSPNWRVHSNALTTLIMLRGGLKTLIRSAPHVQPAMLAFLMYTSRIFARSSGYTAHELTFTTSLGISANTTSPSSDLVEAASHLRINDLIASLYRIGVYPTFPCPLYLFLDILKINCLRTQAIGNTSTNDTTRGSTSEVLDHVQSFSSRDWAESRGSLVDEWLLIARIFQSAVILYGISSLHSLSIVALDNALKVMKSVHRQRLLSMLEVGLVNPRTKSCMMWPLVVAGVEAAGGDMAERKFVAEHLSDMSRELGSSRPLAAKLVFERFWSSGKTNWDDCFNRPYALV